MAKSKDMTFGSEYSVKFANSVMYAVEESLNEKATFSEPRDEGMIGTDKPANLGRQVTKKDVGGDLVIQPTYAHAQTILKQFFDETTSTFTPADDPDSMQASAVIDRGVDVYSYPANWLNILALEFNENEPVNWRMSLLGTTETDAGTVAALTIPDRMLFSDLTVSIGGSTYFPISGVWRFDYQLEERFHQSVTRSSVAARIPMAQLDLEFDVNSDTWADLIDNAGTDAKVADVILAFTDGTSTITITMEDMTVMNESKWPDASGVDGVTYTLNLNAWLESGQSDIMDIVYVAS